MSDTSSVAFNTSYQDILLAEAVRFHEAEYPIDANYAESLARKVHTPNNKKLFPLRIFKRAQVIDQTLNLSRDIEKIHKKYYFFIICLLFVSAITGFLSSQLLLLQQSDVKVNVYAVLLALLLPNALSLLLTGIMLLYRPHLKTFNVFYVFQNLYKRMFARGQVLNPAWEAWQSVRLRENFSKWWLTASSNVLWLMFLVGALLGLVWRMSVHQYFFGWESTLLPSDFFVSITQSLAWPFQLLGFNVPTYADIVASDLKLGANMNAGLSTRWAIFILSCLVCYAVIPRCLMAMLSGFKYKVIKRSMCLDDSDLAYSKLYKNLMLHEELIGVVDTDEQNLAGNVDIKTQFKPAKKNTAFTLPKTAQLFTFELYKDTSEFFQEDSRFVLNIEDRRSQALALEACQQNPDKMCVLVISLLSVPDRGTQRFLKSLLALKLPVNWIFVHGALAKQRFREDIYSQRIYDWHMCGKALGLDEAQLHILDINDRVQMDKFLMCGEV